MSADNRNFERYALLNRARQELEAIRDEQTDKGWVAPDQRKAVAHARVVESADIAQEAIERVLRSAYAYLDDRDAEGAIEDYHFDRYGPRAPFAASTSDLEAAHDRSPLDGPRAA